MSSKNEIRVYDDAPRCDKCDEDDKDTFELEFCRKPGAKPVCTGYPDGTEHLHFTCRCGYQWLTETNEGYGEETKGLPDFGKDCPKCSWGADAKWCQGCPEAEKEHMHMKCTACKFTWLSQTSDTPFEDEGELAEMREERKKVVRRGTVPPPRHARLEGSEID